MFLTFAGKPDHQLLKKAELVFLCVLERLIEFVTVDKRNPKMARIHFRDKVDFVWIQMADNLVAEEVKGNPVMVPSAKAAAKLFIKINCFIEVLAWNRKVEYFIRISHIENSFR
jgi:hypothetical protein